MITEKPAAVTFEEQYERLPVLAQDIVRYQRKIDNLLADDVIPLSVVPELRRLKTCRDEAARGMALTYGTGKSKDGTKPSLG